MTIVHSRMPDEPEDAPIYDNVAFEGTAGEFMAFRQAIADTLGIGSIWHTDRYFEDMGATGPEAFAGDWEVPPVEPIAHLMVHSHDGGHILPQYLFQLAARLEQAAAMMEDTRKFPGTFEPMSKHVRGFAEACLVAYDDGLPLEFAK